MQRLPAVPAGPGGGQCRALTRSVTAPVRSC